MSLWRHYTWCRRAAVKSVLSWEGWWIHYVLLLCQFVNSIVPLSIKFIVKVCSFLYYFRLFSNVIYACAPSNSAAEVDFLLHVSAAAAIQHQQSLSASWSYLSPSLLSWVLTRMKLVNSWEMQESSNRKNVFFWEEPADWASPMQKPIIQSSGTGCWLEAALRCEPLLVLALICAECRVIWELRFWRTVSSAYYSSFFLFFDSLWCSLKLAPLDFFAKAPDSDSASKETAKHLCA